MKKIVGIIAAAALATSAFAEINIGSWNRAVFVPVAYDGENVNALENTSWGGPNAKSYGVRTGLGFSASSENAGFVMDLHNNPSDDGCSLGLGDNGYAWVKPVEVLTVKFGKIDNNWGRQDVCFGMWDRYRFGGRLCAGEGIAAWRSHNNNGAEVTLKPVENLVIDYQGGFGAGNERAYKTLWHNADFMIGYTIPDTAFIRAIVAPQAPAANYDGDDKENMTFGLAADITAVENLKLSIGTTIPTMFDKADGVDIPVGVGAAYNMDALTLHALARFNLYGTTNDKRDGNEFGKLFALYAGVGVDFAINDVFTLITDVRFHTYLGDKDYVDYKQDGAAFGAYVGLSQKLTNASFDFGVMLAKAGAKETNMAKPSQLVGASDNGEDKLTFAIPLTMTVSF
jgi:hypothetical protein